MLQIRRGGEDDSCRLEYPGLSNLHCSQCAAIVIGVLAVSHKPMRKHRLRKCEWLPASHLSHQSAPRFCEMRRQKEDQTFAEEADRTNMLRNRNVLGSPRR